MGSLLGVGQFIVDSEADACPKQAQVVQNKAWARPVGVGSGTQRRLGWLMHPGSAFCSASGHLPLALNPSPSPTILPDVPSAGQPSEGALAEAGAGPGQRPI